MDLFLGQHTSSLDSQSRCALSVEFRTILLGGDSRQGTNVVAFALPGPCIAIAHQNEFESIVQALSTADDRVSRASRLFFFAHADRTRCDPQGRVRLAPFHLTRIGVQAAQKGDLIVVGAGRYLTVWSAAGWQKFEARLDDDQIDAIERVLTPSPNP
jgi:division/cell wall cluster transcriptional repressor MraZ